MPGRQHPPNRHADLRRSRPRGPSNAGATHDRGYSRYPGKKFADEALHLRATDGFRAAVAAVSRAGAKFISRGNNLLDLVKREIAQPPHLVDISRLPFEGQRKAVTAQVYVNVIPS